MRFTGDCRSRALLLLEIAETSPEFKECCVAVAELWLTLADLASQFGERESRATAVRQAQIRPRPQNVSPGPTDPSRHGLKRQRQRRRRRAAELLGVPQA
jgi:hypothetical protein